MLHYANYASISVSSTNLNTYKEEDFNDTYLNGVFISGIVNHVEKVASKLLPVEIILNESIANVKDRLENATVKRTLIIFNNGAKLEETQLVNIKNVSIFCLMLVDKENKKIVIVDINDNTIDIPKKTYLGLVDQIGLKKFKTSIKYITNDKNIIRADVSNLMTNFVKKFESNFTKAYNTSKLCIYLIIMMISLYNTKYLELIDIFTLEGEDSERTSVESNQHISLMHSSIVPLNGVYCDSIRLTVSQSRELFFQIISQKTFWVCLNTKFLESIIQDY